MMNETRIKLIEHGEKLSIENIADLYPKLLAVLLDNKGLTIDCQGVNQIDTAALQLLFAFSKTARIFGQSLQWCNIDDNFIQSAQLLGLNEAMSLSDNSAIQAMGR